MKGCRAHGITSKLNQTAAFIQQVEYFCLNLLGKSNTPNGMLRSAQTARRLTRLTSGVSFI
jgi:hypothetical protein